MKITLIGASGNVGSRILKELSDRGHAITAIARQPEMAGTIGTNMIITAALVEGCALFAVVVGLLAILG